MIYLFKIVLTYILPVEELNLVLLVEVCDLFVFARNSDASSIDERPHQELYLLFVFHPAFVFTRIERPPHHDLPSNVVKNVIGDAWGRWGLLHRQLLKGLVSVLENVRQQPKITS